MKKAKRSLRIFLAGLTLATSAFVFATAATAAHYLIDDTSFTTLNSNDSSMVQSGWNFDNQGGFPKLTDAGPYELNDVSSSFGTRLIRTVTAQSTGTMTLESKFTISAGNDGFYYELQSTSGATAYKLITDNGYFNVVQNGTLTQLSLAATKATYSVRVILNLDTHTSQTVINSVSYGTHNFASTTTDIKKLILGTTATDVIYVVPSYVTLTSDYSINERFTQTSTGSMPLDWTSAVTGSATANVDTNEMKLALTGTGTAAVQKTFAAVSGNVCYESLFLLPTQADGAVFKLMSGTTVAVSLKTLNNQFYANTTMLRNYYLANMWYKLRIEANTATDTAVIKIDGKVIGTVPFETAVTSLDSVKVELAGTAAATLKFDEVEVSVLPNDADYVTEPVVPTKTTSDKIGINVCSLWRNGEHWGWDNITAFDEVRSVLGAYDDFTPEVADWEIKFMSEHGIDYGSYCWYSTQSNAPIKSTRLSGALERGFMNAKYSNYMKFSLLWEAQNASHPASSAAFRAYFVPYWVENFFTDSRYMVLDNKPVITVFGYNQLITDFGSAANVAAELNYVRTVCQGLGFDGAIFLACCSSSTTAELQKVKDCGFDGVQAYNWGKTGNDPAYTQTAINAQYNANILHVVPTVSTGFNNVGWGGARSANMTMSDFSSMLTWIRDTALPRVGTSDWKSKLLMISTWNEYGEGTYVMPSGLNGFGYLDAIRTAFTANPAHTDSVPTTTQKARLGYMFPQDRALIRPLKVNTLLTYPQDVLQSWDFVSNRTVATGWTYGNQAAPTVVADSGSLSATASNYDPIIQIKNDLNLDISKIHYVKVRASGVVGNNIQVFFTTTTDTTLSESKSISIPVTSLGIKDYYLPIYTNSAWSGTLKTLRIDPISTSGGTFKVESVSLMYDASNNFQTWNFVNTSGAISTEWNYSNMGTPAVAGGAITSTPTNTDPLISINSDINLNISNVTYIKVKASGPVGNTLQVFFSTVADPTITEAKSISTSITSTTLTDYYLPISTKAGWTGTLKRLRIDPINSQNAFKIDSVTLLYTATPMTLNVNQTAVPLLNNPISLNSHYLIPMAPDTGVFNYFNSYFEWNKASGNLTMYGNNHTIAFTMGSSNASVDGVTTALGCTPYLLDGIPMVPVDAITTAFGYTISYGTGTIDVTTPFSAFYDVFRNNANNIWEFNVPNYPEGWTFYQMASDFSQTGAIGGSATITGGGTYDPIMFSPTLNITGGTYSKVKVGMKHALTTATSGTAKIFYITSTSTSYSADKCITGTPTVTPQSSGTNYIEYTFDISAITGTITQIRFDPFDAQGSFYVDYVRFQQ